MSFNKKTFSLSAWLSWLDKQHPKNIDLGLERIKRVADKASLQYFDIPVITVAGTNGKGSTIACLESIYKQAGYNVGSYTSPHLRHYNERVRINAKPVSDASLCDAFYNISELAQDTSLTYFEYGTLAAWWIFQKQALDVIILEVGLGGRLDAVNCVDADIAIIATIDFDHQDWLGHSREEIAREKAGILRFQKPAIIIEQDIPDILYQIATTLEVPLYCYEQAFTMILKNDIWYWQNRHKEIALSASLPIPTGNIGAALQCVHILNDRLPVNNIELKTGIEKINIPGRCQLIKKHPLVLVDVAHNPQSAVYLANYVKTIFSEKNFVIVTSALADKDIAGIYKPFLGWISTWYIAPLTVTRAASCEKIIAALDHENVLTNSSIKEAYQRSLEEAKEETLIIVFGSFFVAGEILSLENVQVYPGVYHE